MYVDNDVDDILLARETTREA